MFLSLVLAQTIAATPPERIDLTIPQPCVPWGSADEVVVCASRSGKSPYELNEVPETAEGMPKAELNVAPGVTLTGETEAADVGGMTSNRGMIRLKVKF